MLGVNYVGAKFKRYRKDNSHKLIYRLPWAFLIGHPKDGVVYLKTNALMRGFTFHCPDLGTSDAETINRVSMYFNSSVKQLGDGWGIQIESRRDYTNEYPGKNWTNMLGYLIDARRKDNFQNGSHFKNSYFLTITYALPNDVVTKVNSLLYKKNNTTGEEGEGYYNLYEMNKQVAFFISKSEEILSYISARIKVEPMDNDAICTYIHSTLSTDWQKRIAPKSPQLFDSFICDHNVDTGNCIKIDDMYCPIITVMDFPANTYPAMFDSMNAAGIEYRWTTRWIGIDKINSQKLLEKYQKKFYGARKSAKTLLYETAMNTESGVEDPSASQFEGDVNDAQIELSTDSVSFGFYTTCVMVWDSDYEQALKKAKYIQTIINSCGFSAKIEGSNSFHAWLSMMPGNMYDNVRKYLTSSANSAHLFPLSSVWEGMRNNRWTEETFGSGAPLLTCTTPDGVPFFLNLNINDVFHSFVFGPTGAGKSTFLCLLESQWLMFPDAHVIVLDKDKTARGVCIGAGGSYVEPGSGNVAFQPLRDIDTEVDLLWACEFIGQCIAEQHVKVTAKMSEAIKQALVQLRDTKDPEGRTITSFQQYCTDEEVKMAIQPYTLTGQYGQIFDARDTSIAYANFVMIELGTLMKMGQACVTPALMYLFKYIERHFAEPNDKKGHMTMLVMDEAWAYLDNEYFSKTIADWLKTLRKKHVCVIFATQNVSDAAKSRISDTIVSQCLTKFYLADPSASNPAIHDAYRKFGLEDEEINALMQARMKRDYFYKSPNGARMFQLELDRFQLSLIAPDSKVLDKLEEKYGMNCGKQLAAEVCRMQGEDPDKYLGKRRA